MPFIRTFAPIVAGAVDMNYGRFLLYNVVGGLLWGAGVTMAGFYLGHSVPDIDRYFLAMVVGVILLSALPTGVHLAREYGPLLRQRLTGRLREGSIEPSDTSPG